MKKLLRNSLLYTTMIYEREKRMEALELKRKGGADG